MILKMKINKEKTIKQVADELGISKQALYKRIRREPLHTKLHTHIKKKGQATYIDIDGQKIIKLAINQDDDIQDHNTCIDTNQLLDVIDVQSIISLLNNQLEEKDNQLLKLNERLDVQLKIKDNQISELNKRLAESQKLNRNQQILLKNEQEKLLLLESAKGENLINRLFKKYLK